MSHCLLQREYVHAVAKALKGRETTEAMECGPLSTLARLARLRTMLRSP